MSIVTQCGNGKQLIDKNHNQGSRSNCLAYDQVYQRPGPELWRLGSRENYKTKNDKGEAFVSSPPPPSRPCCSSPYTSPWNPKLYPNGVCVFNKSQTDCSYVQNQADCNNVGWPDATFLANAFDSEKIWAHGGKPPELCLTNPIAQGSSCSQDLIPCEYHGTSDMISAQTKQDCIDHVKDLGGWPAASWAGPPFMPGAYNCQGMHLAPNGGIYSGCIKPHWTPIRISDSAEGQWCPPRKPP